MGFLKGSVSFTQFEIADHVQFKDQEEFNRRIKAKAFQAFFPKSATESIGWTSFNDVLNTDFAYSAPIDPRYRIFSLRIDRRMIPAAVMKMRCLEAEKKWLAENRVKKIYKDQREAIRESVRLELEENIPPVPKVIEVVWNVEEGTVYVGSLSPNILQNFVDIFRTTFDLQLNPTQPFDLEACKDRIKPYMIQREFLTWLWFKTEEREGVINVAGLYNPIQAYFVRRVALESGEGEYTENVICQGQHADLKEAKEAIRQGKKIIEARIQLYRPPEIFEFTQSANCYEFRTMKLPALKMEGEEEALSFTAEALERIFLVEKAVDTMMLLQAMFLKLRLSADWPAEVAKMERWAMKE